MEEKVPFAFFQGLTKVLESRLFVFQVTWSLPAQGTALVSETRMVSGKLGAKRREPPSPHRRAEGGKSVSTKTPETACQWLTVGQTSRWVSLASATATLGPDTWPDKRLLERQGHTQMALLQEESHRVGTISLSPYSALLTNYFPFLVLSKCLTTVATQLFISKGKTTILCFKCGEGEKHHGPNYSK